MILRRLALCLGWLAAIPLTASAAGSIDFTWRTCGPAAADSVVTFSCTQPDSVALLNG